MNPAQLIDWPSIAIVVGGTLAATLLRCGLGDTAQMLRALGQLLSRRFDAPGVKAQLAAQIQEIEAQGLLRAEPRPMRDGEFGGLADTIIARRSAQALYDQHAAFRARRMALAETGAGVLSSAAELAPVLGLAGTLLSLGSLTTTVQAEGNYAAAIGMAVSTTLYGLVIANFLFAPLAAAVQRRFGAEDRARAELLDWLAASVERAKAPRAAPGAGLSRRTTGPDASRNAA
ncbi:conserved hypothetical protein [Altererythrobacter sp. B11]|uniref:MotA/TolQ/ExbB proton channel family protein n=1 Tax=Altererythrobacter sp. B11 TaxID=2060312 RepID=UPI000DC72CA7|nr:MotA/TolQ/ExbB proton channel family protein [Altererythrobacter sp. B11]BBC72174.1 conserved hypothetical protein [Altererythrobacter sp. B11]